MSGVTSGILLFHNLKIQLRTDKLWEMEEVQALRVETVNLPPVFYSGTCNV